MPMSCLKNELLGDKICITYLLVLNTWMVCKKHPMFLLDSSGYKKQRLQQFPQLIRETIQRETKAKQPIGRAGPAAESSYRILSILLL